MKYLIKALFNILKGDVALRVLNRTPRILFWHGVDHRVNKNVEAEIFDIDIFEKQIEYIIKHYEVISIEEFEKRFLNNTFTNREIVLTFDDGYANNLYILEPILNKYNLPFTVFISTEHITTGQFFPTSVNRIIVRGAGLKSVSIPSQNLNFFLETEKDVNNAINTISNLLKILPLEQVREITNDLINNVSKDKWFELQKTYKSVRPMNWDEVIELSNKDNVTIGSHCMWHICCHSNHPEEVVTQQIELSKLQIEEKLNKECKYFAYPNGNFTDYSNEIVENNYSMGFSTNSKEKISTINRISIIPRIGVPLNINTFRIIINL
jgi:peptidoglycan/xylan/chitin deacetylase (PgdA/CDA1 family)